MFQGKQGPSAHCVHIAERVGGRDCPKRECVVDDRGKEVHRLNERRFIIQPVDGGIVRGVDADEQVGVTYRWNLPQHLRQVAWTELAGSARAVGQGRKPKLVVSVLHERLLPQVNRL